MRSIKKSGEPKFLVEWRAQQKATGNYCYDAFREKDQLKRHLIGEQGALCAYTGQRISESLSHIEHLKPQAHCLEGEDTDYHNLVACFPGSPSGRANYGAHFKEDWPSPSEQHLFVSPIIPSCSGRFRFRKNGKVEPMDEADEPAEITIERLNLNDGALVEMRKEAIRETTKGLDAKAARSRLNRLRKAEEDGVELEPFCFVLVQALEAHIKRLKYIRNSSNS